jgi:hypothetical protein
MVRLAGVFACALLIGGCASSSVSSWMPGLDALGGGGGGAELRFDSEPPGAEARTSGGQACHTPCSLVVPASDTSVTFSLANFLPVTVPVRVRLPGDPRTDPNADSGVTFDPNPVAVQLEAAPPPPPPKRRKQATRRAPPAARAAPPAAAAPPAMQPPLSPALQPSR